MIKNKEHKKNIKSRYYFGLTTCVLYLIFGSLQILSTLVNISTIKSFLFLPDDIIGGFFLILIGLVFMFGIYEIDHDIPEGIAYIYMGIILSLFFMCIYLLILIINYIQVNLLLTGDTASWSPIDDLKPGIYLGLLSIVAFIVWRKKFSIKKFSA